MVVVISFPNALFVTGTDTDIGKTFVSSVLVAGLSAMYWKPVQTGYPVDRDTDTVCDLAGIDGSDTFAETFVFRDPVSPHAAARVENRPISLDDFSLPDTGGRPLVVEGAGGALVPLNETHSMADLMARLNIPAVIVARTGLGTLNHTLLSVEALRSRGVSLFGIILNGPPHPDNERDLAALSGIRLLGRIPRMDIPSPSLLRSAFRSAFS